MKIKSISIKLFLLLAVAISLFSLFFISRNYKQYHSNLDRQLQQTTEMALEFDLAIRKYVATKIRPAVSELIGKDEFIPETMSTSYVARSIFEDVQKNFPNFILKFSSKNPRNPKNLASSREEEIIDFLTANPELNRWHGNITIDDQHYMAIFNARRVKESCLRCHGNPEDAPASLIERYGAKAGFHYQRGQIIATDTVAANHALIETELHRQIKKNYPIVLLSLIALFSTIFLGVKFLILNRISRISRYFNEIAGMDDYAHIQPLKTRGNDEIDTLAKDFNILADKISGFHLSLKEEVAERRQAKKELQKLYNDQESLIDERTADLAEANSIIEARRLEVEESNLKLQNTTCTLQKKQEVMLAEQEKQNILFGLIEKAKKEWEMTMDCIRDMVLLTDPGMRIKRCNRAVLEFTGKEYKDLIGNKWTDILNDSSVEQNSFAGQASEYFHQPTGRWFYLNIYPLKTKNRLEGLVITLHDLTDQKVVSQALEEKNVEIEHNRKQLQLAMDSISKLIVKATEEQTFDVFFSHPILEKCWESNACEEKECPCYGKEPQRCWQILGTLCDGACQDSFMGKKELCATCNHYLQVTADPIYRIGEQFNNMMHILATKNEEVNAAYTELKQTQSQLLQQEKMASIGQLAAGVAHEINNPVGFISSNLGSLNKYVDRLNEFVNFQTELIKESDLPDADNKQKERRRQLKLDFILEDIVELIVESLDGCDRVKKIVQDLKGFSRVDEAEKQHADINECLETTLNIVWNELKYKTKIEKEYGTIDTIECYPQQLNQVFMNLLINGAHAIEKEGIIKIKTWQDSEFLYTRITDNGKGISKENQKRIFEPFFTTKEVGKGTGLGLSIVYDIVSKNHNGDIEVESEEGKGTTFTVKLPINPR